MVYLEWYALFAKQVGAVRLQCLNLTHQKSMGTGAMNPRLVNWIRAVVLGGNDIDEVLVGNV